MLSLRLSPPPADARRSVRARTRLALALCALALGSCGATPTLPLPPPVASVGAPNLQGLVTVEGQANEEAYVTVLNLQTDRGRITRAGNDGHFSVDIEAQPGDRLDLYQESDGVEGEHAALIVPAPAP